MAKPKLPSEADAGSMAGYDPNMGLPKNQVPNSGFTPKTGPLAPKAPPAAPKPDGVIKRASPAPLGRGTMRMMAPGAMRNAQSTVPMAPRGRGRAMMKGMKAAVKGRSKKSR